MRLRNFALGINSYPSSSPGSNHTTARDVLNLRVDGDGYLRLAPGVQDWYAFDSKVTGIAKAHDHLFFLLEDGELWVVTRALPDVPRRVGSTEMRGKLSVIDTFETFFLLTSQAAEDPGYYYDVATKLLQPLTYEQTMRPTSFVRNPLTDPDNLLTVGHSAGRFFYFFAEVKENSAAPEGTPAAAFHAPLSEASFVGTTGSLGAHKWQVDFSGFEFVNDDTTAIYIYRSPRVGGRPNAYEPQLSSKDALDFYEPSAYFRVGRIARRTIEQGTTKWTDDNQGAAEYIEPDAETPVRWREREERESMGAAYILKDGLPDFTRAWTHFNGYNFAATGDRLRYSQIDFGVLKHTEFPEANSINAPGDTHFVVPYDETLVFGDAAHLNVLRGYDPFNFQVYQVASVGPVSAYSASVLPGGGLGFIAQDGFYVYDGESVEEISTPQLDRFFEDRVAIDGTVLPLPNSESLWSVEFDNGSKFTFLLNTERLDAPIWTRLSFLFDQGTAFPVTPLGTWSFDEAGQWVFDDETAWGYTDSNALPIQEIFLVRNTDVVEQYLWHDLESGIRADNEWLWESNLMRGGSETVKVYDRLKLAGYAENPINVDFDLDIKGETVEKSVEGASFTKNARKKRIPIKRRANGITFQISGEGEVLLREVELDSRAVGRV